MIELMRSPMLGFLWTGRETGVCVWVYACMHALLHACSDWCALNLLVLRDACKRMQQTAFLHLLLFPEKTAEAISVIVIMSCPRAAFVGFEALLRLAFPRPNACCGLNEYCTSRGLCGGSAACSGCQYTPIFACTPGALQQEITSLVSEYFGPPAVN